MNNFQDYKNSKLQKQKENKQVSVIEHSFNLKSSKNFVNLTFNTNLITFSFNQSQQQLLNEDLRIQNHTQSKIYYQISGIQQSLCNILPNNDIIYADSIVKIKFRLNVKAILDLQEIKQKSGMLGILDEFIKEKSFEFKWGKITDDDIKSHIVPQTFHQQTLRIQIVQSTNIVFKEQLSPQFHTLGLQKSVKSMRLSQSLSKSKNQDISMININNKSHLSSKKENKSMSQSTQLQRIVQTSSFLSFPLVLIVAIFSFFLGFIFG